MTVRMELAALRHSAGPETNDAVRSRKTVSSRGARRGVLEQGCGGAVGGHAVAGGPGGRGHRPILSPTAAAFAARRKEEEEEEVERVQLRQSPTMEAARLAQERAR